MKHKKFLILLLIIIIGISVYFFVFQFYPIILIDWQPISFKSFKKDLNIAFNYYQRILETYDKKQATVMNSEEIKKEISRSVLDKLIEDELIRRELKKRLKNNEIEKMTDGKIEEAIKRRDIEKEVKTLYGVSFNEFKERLLKPQVKKEILEARLRLENKNIDNWLKEIKLKTQVLVFLPDFIWSGEGVIIK